MEERERHRAAGELFREALRRPTDERRSFVARVTAGRPELEREVESLLRHHADDSFLERPPEPPAPASGPPQLLPERIGSYRVLSALGWGGAGVVYLAEQEHPRRKVAVKVLRWDLASPEALQRFRCEAEILGRLAHPGIARVLEAGTADGPAGPQRYIAMEYVDGRPLLEAARSLDHRARVALAAGIAAIVEHAHANDIVHRDLKPANVLVRAGGEPVVLDFGIALQLEGADCPDALSRAGFETVTGQLLGTLAYMSPEQAAGGRRAVDKRSDVYSLGVVAYELITGQLPYDTREKLITEALRMVEVADPTPLSHYGRHFAGDLETVISMALRKEPERRYATAGELAADLRRVLDRCPVDARPTSRSYRARKLLLRNWRAAAALVAVGVFLSVALTLSWISLDVARAAERREAAQHAATQRLADRLLLHRLESELPELWPMSPITVERYNRWMDQAVDLSSRAAVHAGALADPRAHSIEPEDIAPLAVLVDGLERFGASGGPLEEIARRRSFALGLAANTIEAHAGAWSEAVRAIADHPAYGGMVLEPQLGLVPLGPDPDSGLWEFGHFGPTGELAGRDETTGRLLVRPGMGLVFVLLPGGDFLFGAQANDPTGLHYDPSARSHEGPPEPVRLAPFFLSKFEMTQAQWTRVTGRNPSYWADGDRIGDFAFGPLTPIESITWSEGVEVLARLDLTLPTESQWEYAARGDTHSVWWSGDTADGIGAVANLTGRGDGFQLHAPIGSFPPNPFGLHEILGNLSEWCLDVFKVECRDWPLRAGDGQRETPDGPERVIRGGSSTSAPTYATCARRDDNLFYEGHRITTVRPALGLRGRNARLVPTGGSH